MSTYNDNLLWRYATKKFDPSKKLTEQQLTDVLEAARLAASSYGLQPYRCFVVTNSEIRKKIREHSWDQPQITDASHLVIFCSYRTLDTAYVDAYVDLISKTRGVSVDSLKGYRDMMVGSVSRQTPESLVAWTKCQAYIGLGFLLSAAAQHQIDACPMEGFDATHVDVDLGLAEQNLTAAVFCPLGFRAADDPAATYKKVRYPAKEFFVFKK